MMENMGLRVLSEHPYRIELGERHRLHPGLRGRSRRTALRYRPCSTRDFEEAFAQLWRGQAENDGFNRLILGAGLSWRQVAMLRALQQVPAAGRRAVLADATSSRRSSQYPLLVAPAGGVVRGAFRSGNGQRGQGSRQATACSACSCSSRHSPAATRRRRAALQPVLEARARARANARSRPRAQRCSALLDRVSSLDEDRILRSFIGVIDATLRTSYYLNVLGRPRADGGPRDYVSYKLDSARFPTCPSRGRTARSSSTARASKACTCASARSRAAACAGRIGARISAPKCWAWSRRRW